MRPLVLVRGGGDIASGTIYRLKQAGYPVVVTEIMIPTMIRQTVSYGAAVHVGEVILEGLVAHHTDLLQAQALLEGQTSGRRDVDATIPIVTLDYKEALAAFRPTVVVDAILAKRNLGTSRDDADLVLALGPGFCAGQDVDIVIETMRGHCLGRVIREGFAQPNTGIPGSVGGYTHERVMHAPCDGLFTARRRIGESVQEGEVVGYVDGVPVAAKIKGVLRGILTSGLMVSKGFKLADVDARCQVSHCYSISDKSLAVAGGVMEAISQWEWEQASRHT